MGAGRARTAQRSAWRAIPVWDAQGGADGDLRGACGGGGQGEDGSLGEEGSGDQPDAQVRRAEVVAPLGDAVRLIDHQQRRAAPLGLGRQGC